MMNILFLFHSPFPSLSFNSEALKEKYLTKNDYPLEVVIELACFYLFLALEEI